MFLIVFFHLFQIIRKIFCEISNSVYGYAIRLDLLSETILQYSQDDGARPIIFEILASITIHFFKAITLFPNKL